AARVFFVVSGVRGGLHSFPTRRSSDLVSRLEGGLVAELKEPDRDVKRAVLERLLTQQGANPEAALIDYLSDRPTDSVRSPVGMRSEEHTSELQSLRHLVCRLLLEKNTI